MVLGNGPSNKAGIRLVKEHNMECWGCNFQNWAEMTLLFQMHGDHFVKARFLDIYREYPPKVPIIMQHVWREIPTSVKFPRRQYIDTFKTNNRLVIDDPDNIADDSGYVGGRGIPEYHACSMSYMIGMALMMECFDPIWVYGVDFYHELRHEAVFEKPCVEAHIFFGIALGHTFHIPAASRLFTTSDNHRQVYGVEWNPPLKLEEVESLNEKERLRT